MAIEKTISIQVTGEGAFIHRELLREAVEFEAVVADEFVLVRPKNGDSQSGQPAKSWLDDLVGIAETRDPEASERVEEILMDEIDRRAGWTLDPYPEKT